MKKKKISPKTLDMLLFNRKVKYGTLPMNFGVLQMAKIERFIYKDIYKII